MLASKYVVVSYLSLYNLCKSTSDPMLAVADLKDRLLKAGVIFEDVAAGHNKVPDATLLADDKGLLGTPRGGKGGG